MAKEITQEKLDKMINIVLRAKGTPRERLFILIVQMRASS